MNRLSFAVSTSLIVGSSILLAGCQRDLAAPPAPPPPVVSITHPVRASVQDYYEYNGNLEPVEMVLIKARVKGFLDAIKFKDGDEVKQKDLLFQIDPREYIAAVKKAEADKKKAITELKRAQLDEARAKKLFSSRAASEEEYEQRVAARETAEAVLMQTDAALDTAKLQFDYTEIRSPIAGQISRTLVTRGNLVGQNESTLLTTIVSMDPLYVYFDAPERDLPQYHRSLETDQSLPVEVGVGTEVGYPHAGTIDFRENRVDVGTGTVRIRGRIPNPRVGPEKIRRLYPGLYVRVRVPVGAPQTLPAIPEDALMTGQEGRYVYVLDDKNVVSKRTVTVGPHVWKAALSDEQQALGWTVTRDDAGAKSDAEAGAPEPRELPVPSVVTIERGLDVGDRVLINGLTKARPGSPVAPEAWELHPPAK